MTAPDMGDGSALVLHGRSAHVLAVYEPAAPCLSPEERARAARLPPAARRDFTAAHLLIRHCAAAFLGTPAHGLDVVQRCAHCRGPHGRPTLRQVPRLYVTLSHCAGHVAAAASWHPVGVDVERLPPGPGWRRAGARSLTRAESALVARAPCPPAAFLRQWVRKEALVKAGSAHLGGLRRVDLSELPVDDLHGGPLVRRSRWRGWSVMDWRDGGEAGVVGAAVSCGAPRLLTVSGERDPRRGP
ncbi:4'-phosphopantetheinyl transferase family protein [Streptomyces eurocidicus]|uniref:4'-phosphopantetheinyl transferase n=1 Tax=Streptomyces eurocidicus TaxID=66423 RepID=A0A7W8BGG1_STREU|nr:4'-phosphopantetheinyl transferase superfamily protein [Streptomyces eurocidicus]MBB5122288.1 4'-phosphopantetheinyl transferase [Streptomyces eurocidicus]MBF6055172.1 4'-phosphopantetheinyl transferase superfamily protein [Streptomyces eurocidicus]